MNPKEPIQSSDETLPVRMEDVDAIVKSVGTEKHNLIHILHGIQEKYRYLLAALCFILKYYWKVYRRCQHLCLK